MFALTFLSSPPASKRYDISRHLFFPIQFHYYCSLLSPLSWKIAALFSSVPCKLPQQIFRLSHCKVFDHQLQIFEGNTDGRKIVSVKIPQPSQNDRYWALATTTKWLYAREHKVKKNHVLGWHWWRALWFNYCSLKGDVYLIQILKKKIPTSCLNFLRNKFRDRFSNHF